MVIVRVNLGWGGSMLLVKLIVGLVGGAIVVGLSILALAVGLIVLIFTVPIGVIRYSLEGIFAVLSGNGSEGGRISEEAGEFIWAPIHLALDAIDSMWKSLEDFFRPSGHVRPRRRSQPYRYEPPPPRELPRRRELPRGRR
jgi:hypothetical protein